MVVNSITELFYSLDDESLIRMAVNQNGKNLQQFCILLSLDFQIENEFNAYKLQKN
jgi:hypothetical protein